MKATINSVKKVEVAELPLLRLDLQHFSEDIPVDEPIDTPVDDPIDETIDTPIDEPIEPGENVQEFAEPAEPSFKDDPQNQAFAQMRRDKEALEQQTQQMNNMISEMYGESHGIHTFEEYQRAVEAEQQAEEQQRYRDAGLPDEVIEKLSKVDEVLQKAEQEKQDRALLDGFDNLTKEYPDLVKNAEDIPNETWIKWNDGQSGLSLIEAYELTNKQAIREHFQASSKQKTLNQINGKSHIRENGGQGADDIDLGVVPPDVLSNYKMMFKKELKTGEMSEKDFVKHYKNSL